MCDCGTQYDPDWWFKNGGDRDKFSEAYWTPDEPKRDEQLFCRECGMWYGKLECHICQPMEENNERVDGSES